MLGLPEKECTGCSACAMICPVKAVSTVENKEGFLEYQVDESKCIHCRKCEQVCPVINKEMRTLEGKQSVYAAINKDETVHKTSQSGGIFYALSCVVLNKQGVVYGAAQNLDFETEHICITDQNDLYRLQGVKYVQSAVGNAFIQVEEDLRSGKLVLFSGTPCQIAGLNNYLKRRSVACDNLVTVDLVCYGVPSPGIFREWLSLIENKYRAKVTKMSFRRTDALWGKGKEQYFFSNGKSLEGSFYTYLFFNDMIIRPGCESCRFCNMNRQADITLGDFWGIADSLPEFYDDRGVSLVICNTDNGKKLLDDAKEQLVLHKSTIEAATAAQPRLRGIAVNVHASQRNSFWSRYYCRGLKYVLLEEGILPYTKIDRILQIMEHIFLRIKQWVK